MSIIQLVEHLSISAISWSEKAVQAEEQGLLTPHSGDVIYEGTVGSTGISLATICRARGYLAHMYEVTHNSFSLEPLLVTVRMLIVYA